MIYTKKDLSCITNNFYITTTNTSIPNNKAMFDFTSKITIAIPVYERTEFFKESINSAINQTLKCKIIVIDNASSHNYFRDYIVSLDNPNIKYFRNDVNIGMVGNWNKCIDLSETEYLSILHDDDALHPDFIKLAFKEISRGRDFFAFGAYVQESYPRGFKEHIKSTKQFQKYRKSKFLFGTLSPFPGIIFPIRSAKNIGCFNADTFPTADYDFWIRLSEIHKCYRSNTKLAFYRINPLQETNNCYLDILIKAWELRKKVSTFTYLRLLSEYQLYMMYKNYNPTVSDWQELKIINSELYFAMQKQSCFDKNILLRYFLKIIVRITTIILTI